MNHIVSPSLLSADFGNLKDDIEMINGSEADWLHLDIMDGVFVPNISFGFPVLNFVKEISMKPLDVHLMIVEPEKYLKRFRDCGAEILTVHYEACKHLNRSIDEIKKLGMKAGVALNPHSPVSQLKNILPYVDMVLIMTVNPGYGGQSFINNSYEKITELRNMIDKSDSKALIQVDGGVDGKNAKQLIETGVDVLVAGSSVFGSDNPPGTIKNLKNLSF